MPYVNRITEAGITEENEIYNTDRYNKPGVKRGCNKRPTSKKQLIINNRNAVRKLRLILNANFVPGDYHVVLTYNQAKTGVRSAEQMKKDIDVFKRELRKLYKKKGLPFRYIHIMEIGSDGARHHHLVVNQCSPSIIQMAWDKAYEGHTLAKIRYLKGIRQYGKLAAYLIKYTSIHRTQEDGALMAKRWNGSKNLVHPEPKYEIVNDQAWLRAEAKAPKGWYIEKNSIERGIHGEEYHGHGFFRFRIIKL